MMFVAVDSSRMSARESASRRPGTPEGPARPPLSTAGGGFVSRNIFDGLGRTVRTSETLERRVLSKIQKRPSGCWIWTAAVNNHGYGIVNPGRGSPLLVHRVMYQLTRGLIPSGRELDHLCRTPKCVNPSHLEAVTHSENMTRGIPGQPHVICPRGHTLRDPNVYYSRRGARSCRTCSIRRATERRQRLRLILGPPDPATGHLRVAGKQK